MIDKFFCSSCRQWKDTLACLAKTTVPSGKPGGARRYLCRTCHARIRLMSNPKNAYHIFPNGAKITVAMHLAANHHRRSKKTYNPNEHFPD